MLPSLGSKQSFKKLIKKAHSLGIKMFLDVITHGVMSDSPLVKKFPHWFKGGSWGMKDYDWFGKHQDLDDWWINLWLNYVKQNIMHNSWEEVWHASSIPVTASHSQ